MIAHLAVFGWFEAMIVVVLIGMTLNHVAAVRGV